MSNILITIIAAFGFFLIAFALICIGWLITGKMVRIGRCGRVPDSKRDDSCGSDQTCPLCEQEKKDDVQ